MRQSAYRSRRRVFRDLGEGRKHKPDYLLLVLVSALLLCGAVVVYAIGPGLTGGTELSSNYYSSKQLTAIGLGVLAFVLAAATPIKNWSKFQVYVIFLAVLAAVSVRFIGEEINGVHRWIQIGGFSFQPAELVKLALVLWLAKFLADRRKTGEIASQDTLKQLGILVTALVVVVAGFQSDLGSAAVMLAIVGVLSFVAGLPMQKLVLFGGVLAILVLGAISVSQERRERVTTFLNPAADCQFEGYQVCQALITVGSGGLTGKGLGQSVQAYGYLPEPANDSIFAIVSEKFGFVGSAVMVGVFWLLFRRLVQIAKATTDDYVMLLVVGVLVWLSVQMVINVGAMMGLLPLKGITLPFVSYGGTSIIFVMIAMGLVFQASKYTDLSLVKSKKIQHNAFESSKRFRRGDV